MNDTEWEEPVVPFAKKYDFDGVEADVMRNESGLGVGINLKNGTRVFKFWRVKLAPEAITGGPFSIKHTSGLGVGVQLRNGTQMHKFWFVNGTSYVEYYS